MTSRFSLFSWLARLAPAAPFKRKSIEQTAAGSGLAGNRHPQPGLEVAHAGLARQRLAPAEIFTPTRPRAGRRSLVGRESELERILRALNDEAAHVVLYAERGRGKTSLTNLVVERLRRSGATIGRYVCNADSDFNQIMRGLAADLPASLLGAEVSAAGATIMRGCEAVLPASDILPLDVAAIPARLMSSRLICVVDEFDRVKDVATRTKLADTIKLLSDRGIKLLFVIVGVSDTLDRIIGQHPSIQRNVTGVHLQLLADSEIRDLLVIGSESAGVSFSTKTVELVILIARGMPYMAQLMGLRVVQQTLARKATETSIGDVHAAIEHLVVEDLTDAAARYEILTGDPAHPIEAALHAATTAKQDRWGRILSHDLEPDHQALLLDLGIYEKSMSAHGMLQPVDRPLLYYALLLAAKAQLAPAASPRLSVVGSEKEAHGD